MANTYDRLRAMTIRRLGIGRGGLGAAAILTRKVEGTYNPKTGKVEGGIREVHRGSAVRVEYKNWAYKDTSILKDDFQLYLSPVLQDSVTPMITPLKDDVIDFLDESYKVITVVAWNNAGIDCGWKLQMRKG
jgi:hypothetical protein